MAKELIACFVGIEESRGSFAMNPGGVSLRIFVSRHSGPLTILLLAVFIVYARILGHEFMTTWDDDAYITANEAIRGFSAEHVRQAFSHFYVGNYAPVQIISYMLDYTVWGLDPQGFHLTDILLHGANGILLYFLMLRYGANGFSALFGGLIFLCHPVQVEAVAWISQRKTVLSALFMLSAWLLFLRWQQCDPGDRHPGWYLAALGAFLCALLTKAVTVILPVILLLDMVVQNRGEGRMLRRLAPLLPFFLCAVLMAAVTMFSQSPASGGGRTPFHGGSPAAALMTMLPVYVRYLRMLVMPVVLSAEYEVPIRQIPDLSVLTSVLVLALFCYGACRLYRCNRLLFFWLMVFVIGFLPVSQIVPIVTPMNDRYFYLPLVGAAPFFGLTARMLLDRATGWKRPALQVFMTVLLAVLALLSWQRTAVWRNGVTLWSDVVAKAPLNYEAWDSLGSSYIDSGDEKRASMAYKRALALNPGYALSLKNIGVLYLKNGEIEPARQHFLRLVRAQPNNAEAFEFLGLTMKIGGDLSGAEQALSQSLRLGPRRSSALVLLAQLYVVKGDFVHAREFLLRAQQVEGSTVNTETGLATVEAGLGDLDKALYHLEKVLRIKQGDVADILKDPAFAGLRSTEQYRKLLYRYGVVP